MAKVQGPGISLAASGKLAYTIVYANWKGIAYIRQWVVPHNPRTADQVANRDKFASYVDNWQTNCDATCHTAWDDRIKVLGYKMSGFNFFIQQCFMQNITPPALPTLP